MTAFETTPEIGRYGEAAALRYLTDQGLRLLESNFRCRRGEIDLVMEDHDCIVFIEVRYRRSSRFGTPAETVDRRKRRRLTIAAQFYLQTRHGADRLPARFDVVAIRPDTTGLHIEWLRNAFEA